MKPHVFFIVKYALAVAGWFLLLGVNMLGKKLSTNKKGSAGADAKKGNAVNPGLPKLGVINHVRVFWVFYNE
jgi:hypothetical protein